MVWTWSVAGTLDFTPGGILAERASPGIFGVLFVLYMFGIGKAALMPFHRWLPAAMVAPTPVSALLHAVAVVKAGVFTVLKVTVYIFGVDALARIGGNDIILSIRVPRSDPQADPAHSAAAPHSMPAWLASAFWRTDQYATAPSLLGSPGHRFGSPRCAAPRGRSSTVLAPAASNMTYASSLGAQKSNLLTFLR